MANPFSKAWKYLMERPAADEAGHDEPVRTQRAPHLRKQARPVLEPLQREQ